MSALISGQLVLLTPVDQWLLSALLCLITIRLEFTNLEMQGVPVADRRQLMSTGYPPFDTWRIWIARFGGANPEDHWSRHFGMQVVSSPKEIFRPHKCNTQVTTMVIGQLCAHLVSSSVMPIPAGYTGVELTAIWPPSDFGIDSRAIPFLEDAEIVHLHESFAASF
jgi:hypothetical protein